MEDGFYFRHGLSPSRGRPEIPGALQTIADILDRGVSADPDAEALVGRHARYSYRTLHEASLRAAAVLADLGVQASDRVGACLPNQTEVVVAFLGAMRVGAVWVGVPQSLSVDEKCFILDDADVNVLLADTATHDALQPHRGELRDLNQILIAEPGPSEWNLAVAREDHPEPPEDFDPFGPAAIAYTLGTTGRPKGVVHSQHNLILPGAVIAARAETSPGLRQGVSLPLTRLDGLVLGPLLAFQTRSCCVMIDREDAPGVAEWVREEKIHCLDASPSTLNGLLTHPEVGPADLESLAIARVHGPDLPDGFAERYRERFGSEALVGYGLTEAPTRVTQGGANDASAAGTCGVALPHLDVAILGPDGRELPDGEVGEVAIGPSSLGPYARAWTPMLGYWNRPELTRAAVEGSRLRTGDLGWLDPQGRLFITQRKMA